MMKSAEDGPRNNPTRPLGLSMVRRILVQGRMRSQFVVIAGIGRKDPAQVGLADDSGMIDAFPADRTDQSLRMPVLPG